jgi:hypothetical protein
MPSPKIWHFLFLYTLANLALMGILYLSSIVGTALDSLWTIDINTGIGALLGDTGFIGVYGFNYTNDILYGYTNDGDTISLDILTGAGTFIATNQVNASGANGVGGVTLVNAPLSFTLFGIGLAGLAFSRKLKQS